MKANLNFQQPLLQSSVSYDISEIILICWCVKHFLLSSVLAKVQITRLLFLFIIKKKHDQSYNLWLHYMH